jgi:Creatinine amidohydrolase
VTLKWTCSLVLPALCCAASPAGAQILRLTELNAAQLRALDHSKTVVLLTGGMLEEHGPYLPAYTDGILSDRLTQKIAQSIVSKKPGWTVLLFPQIPFGANGSNELGGHPSTIPRDVDLLEQNPIYQKEWIKPAIAHDEALGTKEREWLRTKRP